MPIIRCPKCRIVIVDSSENCGRREVQCPECGSKYHIEISDGEVVHFNNKEV